MRQVSRADVPDMPDRIIAATGIYYYQPRRTYPRRQSANRFVGSPLFR
jgi:hypothetical protein